MAAANANDAYALLEAHHVDNLTAAVNRLNTAVRSLERVLTSPDGLLSRLVRSLEHEHVERAETGPFDLTDSED